MHHNLRNKMIVLPEVQPWFLPAFLLALVVMCLPACSSSLHSPWTRTADQTDAPSEQSGRQLGTPAPNQDGILKVLVYHDMEGLSGQSDWRTFSYRYPEEYRIGRELLVGDVNAVVAGLFDGGADAAKEQEVTDRRGDNPANADKRS